MAETLTTKGILMFSYAVGAALAECEKSAGALHPTTFRRSLALHSNEIRTRPDVDGLDAATVAKLVELAFEAADNPGVRNRY